MVKTIVGGNIIMFTAFQHIDFSCRGLFMSVRLKGPDIYSL